MEPALPATMETAKRPKRPKRWALMLGSLVIVALMVVAARKVWQTLATNELLAYVHEIDGLPERKKSMEETAHINDLLAKGADVNAKNGYALRMAALKNRVGMVKLLLDHGAVANCSAPEHGDSPLLNVVLADDRHEDEKGMPGLLAYHKDAVAIMQLLVAHGADPNYPQNRGQRGPTGSTILQFALIAPFHDGLDILLEAGADPNQRDDKGRTPLMSAVQHKSRDQVAIIRLLLKKGADVPAQDKSGRTSLEIAEAVPQNAEAVQLLKQARATK